MILSPPLPKRRNKNRERTWSTWDEIYT